MYMAIASSGGSDEDDALVTAGAMGAGLFFLVTKLIIFRNLPMVGVLIALMLGGASMLAVYFAFDKNMSISIPLWTLTYGWMLTALEAVRSKEPV